MLSSVSRFGEPEPTFLIPYTFGRPRLVFSVISMRYMGTVSNLPQDVYEWQQVLEAGTANLTGSHGESTGLLVPEWSDSL